MKTFTSRAAIAAAIVVVSGMGWFGSKRFRNTHPTDAKQPLDGSINRGVYTNNFFQFTVQFPADWKELTSMGNRQQVTAQGVSYVLLLVGSTDSQMHGTRWITIAASRPSASSAPLGITAEELVKREADALKAAAALDPGGAKHFHLAGEPSVVSIAGKRMARMDVASQISIQGKDYDAVMSQLTIIERGYLVLFCFSDPKGRESDLEAARKAMDSLRFFGK